MNNLLLALVVLSVTACASTQNKPQLQRLNAEQLAATTVPAIPKMSLQDVVTMSKSGATADAIIAKLNASNTSFDLTPSQSLELAKQGVDVKVLDEIYKTHEQIVQNKHAEAVNQQMKAKQMAEKKLADEKSNRQRSENWWVNRGWGYDPYYGSLYLNQGFGGYRRGFGSNFGYGFGW